MQSDKLYQCCPADSQCSVGHDWPSQPKSPLRSPQHRNNETKITCRRGKNDGKHFTIYILAADKEFRSSFKPQLSAESLAWSWFEVDDVKDLDKHPRLDMLFHGKYKKELERVLDKLDKEGDEKDD